MKKFPDNIKNPSKQYRALPFWSWNGKLEPEMLKWQIREMDRVGLGGYFMHARGGLMTEYMGDEWMHCIQACIEEGNKLGMNSWCYDEEGWPSGFAGGKVPALGIEYCVKWLEHEFISIEELQAIGSSTASYDGSVNGYTLSDSGAVNSFDSDEDAGMNTVNTGRGLLGAYSLDPEGKLLRLDPSDARSTNPENKIIVIWRKHSPYYFDILNKDAVKAFINFTHEKYYEKFKEHFGNGMPGFFTDEPQYSISGIPWSHVIPEHFRMRHGYDVLDMLPALFMECNGYQRVRYDFWSVVSSLFVESYGKQVYEWCNEHQCKFTGHVIMEETLHSQMMSTAGAMPFYEYMHIPGIDWLGRFIDNPMIPRQVSSAANQLGKPFILSEMFALCGWDVSFEELKWIAEWQYVNGVNLMCQHLEGYTLEGARKRDYPPSMFFQQSWWEEYRKFNDYFARLGMLLAEGSNACSVLLLHPIKSAWIAYNHTNTPELKKLNDDFVCSSQILAGLHIDHHYGDETIIGKYGKVKGNKLIVGQCEYSVVVIPSMLTMDEYTYKLLNEYSDNGGIIISTGDYPVLVSGRESNELVSLREKVRFVAEDYRDLYTLLKDADIEILSISENSEEISSIHSRVIDFDGSRAYFMVNLDPEKTYTASIKIKETGFICKLDVETGEVKKIDCKQEGSSMVIELLFLPMQSYVLVTGEAARGDDQGDGSSDLGRSSTYSLPGFIPEAEEPTPCFHRLISPRKEWDIEEADLNSLTLDYCEYSINNGDWNEPVPVIKLMNILLELRQPCDIAMKFSFEADLDIGKNREFMLAIESADRTDISVNGTPIAYNDIGWWKDTSFKKVDIKPYVKNGFNEVILKRRFRQSQKVYDVLFGEDVLETEKNKLTLDTELESIYVIGDFGVISKSAFTEGDKKALFTEGPFIITNQPVRITNGQLTQQGFYFFAGSLKLSQNLNPAPDSVIYPNCGNQIDSSTGCSADVDCNRPENRILLDIGKPDAPVSKLFINDRPVKTLMWAPYRADITEYIKEGDNKITLQLFAGNRNLLGPHHHKDGELHFVAPHDFSGNPVGSINWKDEVWRDRYCFVRFGI